MSIKLWIKGKNAPGGSKDTFKNYQTGRIVVIDAGKDNEFWKAEVTKQARIQYKGKLLGSAITVIVQIFLPRPKSHYRTGRYSHILKDGSPLYPTFKPDATKLWRSTEDALTGVIWIDDAQIIDQFVRKRYANTDDEVGVHIEIAEYNQEEIKWPT